ncbi:MAG: hypothetical protein FWF20_01675 [Betaproteobacteria bacterium]|nr:hypothetical protein [Betaproteobacteria bacterium]MCL2885492.1 hypothetical protein [Betaproteobacteria bacterium]
MSGETECTVLIATSALALFADRGNRKKITSGACPYCDEKVALNHSGKRVAIVLPLVVLFTILLWRHVGAYTIKAIAFVSAGLLYFGTLRVDKAGDT